jgi:hypothetical protein
VYGLPADQSLNSLSVVMQSALLLPLHQRHQHRCHIMFMHCCLPDNQAWGFMNVAAHVAASHLLFLTAGKAVNGTETLKFRACCIAVWLG